jgi:flavin reductase (DIM6/NTAB) family NADH-FMN oxidoreductase RutF
MEFDLSTLTTTDVYKLLTGTVVPRPIAFVTSIDENGVVNAAPFSFFNAVSHDPCLIVLGIEQRESGAPKDTTRNIRERQEFVVNIVDDALAEKMNRCSADYPPGVDELAEVGLTAIASAQVAPPRIKEAPAALECRRYLALELANSRSIIFGEVVHIAIRDDAFDAERRYVLYDRLAAIGRLAGSQYTRPGEVFQLRRPKGPHG